MNAEPNNPNANSGGDSWEGLAEDLFGIRFSQDQQEDEEPFLPDDDDVPTDAAEEKNSESAVTASSESEDVGLPADTEYKRSSGDAAAQDRDVEDEFDVGEGEGKGEGDEPQVSDDQDSFWNGLESWDWGQDSGSDNEQSATRSMPRSRSPRPARPDPPPQKPINAVTSMDAYGSDETATDDDGFGWGILEQAEGPDTVEFESPTENQSAAADPSSAEVASVEKAVPAEQEAQTAPTQKAKPPRRRRKSREEQQPSVESAVETVGVPSSGMEMETSDFAAGVFDEGDTAEKPNGELKPASDTEKTQRRKRRRRSSRRRRKSETPEATETAPDTETALDTEAAPIPEADAMAETSVEISTTDEPNSLNDEDASPQELPNTKTLVYRDIPTWEEAISYLLDPTLIEKKPNESEDDSSLSKKENPRTVKSTKPSSRRGRRRR